MRNRNRIVIYETNCKRCGKLICTANRSIYKLESLKARLGAICKDCATPDEKQELLEATAAAILKQFSYKKRDCSQRDSRLKEKNNDFTRVGADEDGAGA